MGNPFFQGSKQPLPNINTNNNLNNFKQIYNLLLKNKNPQEVFMKMAEQNPQLQPIVQMLQNGANPEQLVRTICAERGIDVNQLLNQFK